MSNTNSAASARMAKSLIELARAAHRSGAWDGAMATYEAALAEASAAGRAGDVADVQRWMGSLHIERGELDAAAERLTASLAVAEAEQLRDRIASGRTAIGILYYRRGDLDDAETEFRSARVLAEEVGNENLVAMIDMNVAVLANIRGDVELALNSYRCALERYERLGDRRSSAMALNNIGMAEADLENLAAASVAFSAAADIAKLFGDASLIRRVDLNWAEVHLKRQNYEAARECVERSLEASRSLESRSGLGEAYKFYGIICRETGKPRQGDTYFALSLAMAEAGQDRLLEAETKLERALLHLEEGNDSAEGVRWLNQSLRIFRDLKATREVRDIERRLTRIGTLYLPAVAGWGASLHEGPDRSRNEHPHRVTEYATAMARELGVTGWDLTWLRVGALIHDVGHAGSEAFEPHPLDHLEGLVPDVVRAHTIIGESMAQRLDFPDEVRPIVRSHHEHWSGTGYPDRLRGDEIPLGARIVGIADTYDTLTHSTGAHAPCTPDEGLRIMQQDLAAAFDPDLLAVFRRIVADPASP